MQQGRVAKIKDDLILASSCRATAARLLRRWMRQLKGPVEGLEMLRAEFYRQKADTCERLAATMSDPDSQERLRRAAQTWRELANQMASRDDSAGLSQKEQMLESKPLKIRRDENEDR